jgi:hypothetical protein
MELAMELVVDLMDWWCVTVMVVGDGEMDFAKYAAR